MRKALKRQLGREKQALNLAESIESGLRAQGKAKKQRDREYQEALIARDKKPKYVEGPQSQISKEKAERVAKRLAEKKKQYAASDLEQMHAEEMIDLERRDAIYTDLPEDSLVEYSKADVKMAAAILDEIGLHHRREAEPESAGFLGDETFDLDLSSVDC